MKERVSTSSAPEALGPYSQAVKVDRFLFTAGQIAIDPSSGLLSSETIEEQTKQTLTNLKAVIEAGGGFMDNVVKCTVYLKDLAEFERMNLVYAEFFQEPFPARN